MDEYEFFTKILHRDYDNTEDSNTFQEEVYDDLELDTVLIESW